MLRLAAAIALHAGAVAAAISTSAIGPVIDKDREPGPAKAIEVVFIDEPRKSAPPVMQTIMPAKPAPKPINSPERKVAQKPRHLASTSSAPVEKVEPQVTEPAAASSDASASTAEAAPAVATAAASGASSASGGAVADLVITNPRFRNAPRPASYPKRARELGQEGEALVHARLDPDGDPEEVLIWKSSGFALLDNAALAAVRRWQFEPARTNGRAIVAWVEIPVRFQLN